MPIFLQTTHAPQNHEESVLNKTKALRITDKRLTYEAALCSHRRYCLAHILTLFRIRFIAVLLYRCTSVLLYWCTVVPLYSCTPTRVIVPSLHVYDSKY